MKAELDRITRSYTTSKATSYAPTTRNTISYTYIYLLLCRELKRAETQAQRQQDNRTQEQIA